MRPERYLRANQRDRASKHTSATMKTSGLYALAALVLLGAALASALSIEGDPVRVTHRNSGPRYDIDEVERAKALMKEAASTTPAPQSPGSSAEERPAEEVPTVGHVAIRRVFLFPVMRPAGHDWPQSGSTAEGSGQAVGAGREHEGAAEPPMLFAKPFWPFMTPARPAPASHQSEEERPHIIRHLFGADQASRSPSAERDQDQAASGQSERDDPAGPSRPLFDPIQMMMDMMHQAISGQLGPNLGKDLSNSNKGDDNDREASGDNSPAESSDERPLMPAGRFGEASLFGPVKPSSQNETHEDIVEIDGKKYLRKTVVNRHVGDNIVFMTRRLVFIPLNETSESATDLPPTASAAPPEASAESDEVPALSAIHRVGANKPARGEQEPAEASGAADTTTTSTTSTTTTTTTTSTTEAPSTTASAQTEPTTPAITAAPAEQPTSGEPREEASTTKPKAAERLVEAPAETLKPSASSS